MESNLPKNEPIVDMSQLSVEKLLELAQQNFEQNNEDKAANFFEEAYQKSQDNHDLLCKYGHFLMTVENFDKARIILHKAIQINPDQNYHKYMEFAELNNGTDSIQLYEQGIKILQKIIQNHKQNQLNIFEKEKNSLDDYHRDLAQAYSALAEIYQTDLLNHPNSEQKCKDNIIAAIDTDPLCLDAYLQFGNYFLNKEDPENAKKMFKHILQEVKSQEQDDIIMEANNDNRENEQVTYSFKQTLAKVLIEVEEFQDALELLEGLLEEDQSNLDIVYLNAFVNFKLKNYYNCEDILNSIKNDESIHEQLAGDLELQTAFEELHDELQKADFAEALDQQDETMGDDDNEEWMDLE